MSIFARLAEMVRRLLRIGKGKATAPADTQAPTAPVITGVTYNASGQPVVAFTLSTDNVSVTGYEVWRGPNPGTRTRLPTDAFSAPYTDPTAPLNTALQYQLFAYDPSGNRTASNIGTVTTPATPTTDVTPPTVPVLSAPVVNQSNQTYSMAFAPSTDPDPGIGAQVSGVDKYQIEECPTFSGTYVAPDPLAFIDHPTSALGPPANLSIGSASSLGSDSAGVMVASGLDNYGTSDQEFLSGAVSVNGPVQLDWQIDSMSSEYAYNSAGLVFRDSVDPSAVCFRLVIFQNGTAKLEYRALPGDPSQSHANETTISLPAKLRAIKDNAGATSVYVSDNVVTPSYVLVGAAMTLPFSSTIIASRYGCPKRASPATVTVNHSGFAITGATSLTANGTGTPATTKYVRIAAYDNAGNISRSAPMTLTFNPLTSGLTVVNFPQLANWHIGGDRADPSTGFGSAEGVKAAAHADYTFYGTYASFDGSLSSSLYKSMRAVMAAVKARNPNAKTGLYTNPGMTFMGQTGGDPQYRDRVLLYNWVLRIAFPSGSIITRDNVPGGDYVTNCLAGGPTDPQGRTFVQWYSDYVRDYAQNGGAAGFAFGSNTANDLIDAFICDDLFTVKSFGGDFDRDGNPFEDNNAIAVLLRNGQKALVDGFRVGGKKAGCNNDAGNLNFGVAVPEWVGAFDFQMGEGLTGESFSKENNAADTNLANPQGIWGLIAAYQKWETLLRPGGFVIVGANGLRVDGSQPLTWSNYYTITSRTAAWIGLRFSLAASLIFGNGGLYATGSQTLIVNDGYYPYDCRALRWFPQFKVNPSSMQAYTYDDLPTLGQGYLGTPIDPPQTGFWSGSTFRRRFMDANGKIWHVYLRPRGAGSASVAFGTTLKRISSSYGDPTLDGGQSTSYTLQDRDGFIGREL